MAPAPQWLTNDFFKDIIKRAIDHEISISDDEIIAYISKKRNIEGYGSYSERKTLENRRNNRSKQ